jgi:nucleoside-diphosphate-sugar epimerase
MAAEKVLIVGGSGFVGRRVVQAFLATSSIVSVLNRGTKPIASTEQLIADRNDGAAVQRALLGKSFDVVIDTNCYAPEQAAVLAKVLEGRSERLVIISSAAVYGDGARQPPAEDEPTGGASVWGSYGTGKSAMEGIYREQSASWRSCVVVRPPYIFGPNNSSARETWFWARQARGKTILLPGRGETRAQFIHVDDLAEAIRTLAQHVKPGWGVYNVADPRILTFSELATLLASSAGFEDRQANVGEFAHGAAARTWFPFRDYPCLTPPRKLMDELGFRPAFSLDHRFAETARYYRFADLAVEAQPSETEAAIARRMGIAL